MRVTFSLEVEDEAQAEAILAMLREFEAQGVPIATTEDGEEVFAHAPQREA